ncbi:GntR family transcriptional regulator [Alkalicoccus daliensis]|uniref:DNA-binding transcriptional regulator, LacI/PurR family n=1 Tax=Alkalicoccus daliensis TaxID=745820 RepID=A0A1H0H9K9_9BACI|nr:GntR family transcriptional regulator [Alkalicoccus daliensis]SDO15869.1 DNA-binding transcriptional regulator, LacI/PurR family [Alkalicoccus daliensis]
MKQPNQYVKSSPQYEKIYKEIKASIINQEVKLGEKLPTEKELTTKFNVSRITTKKALDMLVSDQLIERIPGKGSFVTSSENMLKTSSSKKRNQTVIGYIVPDLDESHGLELFLSLENAAAEKNFQLIIKRTYGDINLEKQAIRSLIEFEVDGLIILPVSGEYYNEEIVKLNMQRFPHVLVDRYLKGFDTTMIFTDNREITRKAVDYLFDLQHKHIALFSPPYKDTSAIEDRVEGFFQAYAERGIPINKKIWLTNFHSSFPYPKYDLESIEHDIKLIQEHLKQNSKITAVFAMEYNIAALTYEASRRMNLSIPEDLSIICFDNPENSIGRKQFTHIKQNAKVMGRKAVESLEALIKNESIPIKTTLEAELVEKHTARRI